MNKSKYTIFYSWQSDVKKSRYAIESAINGAISFLLDNHGLNIELDQSTWNIPGMPKIEDVVKDKIEKCDIFIADITPITSKDSKQIPNPNVLIELGYALKAIGPNSIILVAQNDGSWEVKDLPFDINHHRVILFNKKECDLRHNILEIIQQTKFTRTIKKLFLKYFPIRIDLSRYTIKKSTPLINNFPVIFDDSAVFFSQRISYAFPGIKGVKSYTKLKDIKLHMSRLFHSPLKFSSNERSYTPIWWFRAGSSVAIDSFYFVSKRTALIGNEEWEISKVTVFKDSALYYKEYIYVEIEAKKPTLLGQVSNKEIHLGETEEYGILNWKNLINIKITRNEYDDGGCKRFGKIFRGNTELRVRYLTKYNFLICAHQSAYNNSDFDRASGEYMNGLLDNTVCFDEFHKFLMSFPKPQYRGQNIP